MAEYQASLKALNPDGSTASEVSIADEVVTVVGAGESNIAFSSEYDGAHSFQAIAPDLTVGSAAGSNSDPKYLAAVMGNIIGDVLAKTKPILAGLIGKLSITGSRATTYSVSAIRGEVGDGVTDADGAFVAVLGGDSALTTARAAYSVDNENTTPGSGFDYGLDLAGSGTHDGYPAVEYAVADIRFSDGTTQSTGGGAFNGGTITDELVVDTGSATNQALELTGTRTSQHPVFKIDYPHQTVAIDSDGVVTIGSNDTLDVSLIGTASPARFHVTSDQDARADIDVGTTYGVRVAGTTTGLALFQLTSAGSPGYDIFTVLTVGGLADQLVFKINSAPADGDLVAGACALWFDETDGAAKLMVKAKTADGTVRTGSVNLS